MTEQFLLCKEGRILFGGFKRFLGKDKINAEK